MDGPRGPGGASRGRDEPRSLSTKRRWIPPSTVRRDALTPENRNDLIFRKVRGILNKLTPEKFQKLSDDLLQTELNSDVILKGVILLIFEKALDEPKYSSMYAQLCKRLSEEAPNFEQPPDPCTFRILLLNKCRAEFENRTHLNDAAAEDGSLTPEEEERRQIAKRKMLGNIKFIGELGKLEILSESILHRCIQQLLVERRSGRHSKDAAEDLECLCQIMRTCGRILDSDKGQKLMDQYFTRMSNLAKSPELPLRIRFMLRDGIELRRDKWIPRKATNSEGPMPMNQIVEDENRSNSGNHRSGGGGGGFNHQELFRRQLKMRGGLDDMLSGGGHMSPFNPSHHIDKFNSYNSNGYQSGFRQSNRQNHHQGGGVGNQQGGQYYQQNRTYNNNQHNNNNNSNNNATGGGGGKEVPPRFMRKMTAQLSTTNLEEVSLRPSANSMLFKPHNTKPMLPMQSGRPTSLVSESMLSAPPLKPSPPIQTKDPPILIKQATIEKGKSNKKDKGPSKEEVLKKILSLTDELLTSHNAQDALSAFKEQKVPERLVSEALLTVLTQTFDKTDAERDLAVTFISSLKKESLVTGAQFTDSFRQLVNGMADRVSTVPRVYSFVAAFASQSVTEGLLTLAEVAEHTDGGNHYPLLMLTLQHLNKAVGKGKLLQLFNDSKVSLLNTLPECERTKERLCEALDDRSLGYLSPLLRIQAELWKQMLADPNPTQLYKWVKDNLETAHHTDPGFINALVTVLIKYITQESTLGEGSGNIADKILHDKEKSLLEKFKPVLQAFLHEQIELQVTAVYTLQVFCHQLEFPKGMLLRWFLYFYDLEVIEEEAFLKWREEVNEVYPGKGKALFQVNQWLTWLAEAESEEEEEGDI